MVCCAIAGCTNHSRHASKLGIKFHIFPKNSETKRKWITACKREDSFTAKNARVCSLHFTDSDYQRDLKSELLNIPSKRKLKTDAVPTLNLPSSSADSERRNKRTTRAKKRIYCKEDILQESTEVDATQAMSSEIEIKQEPESTEEDATEAMSSEIEIKEEPESTEEDETPTLPCEVEIKEEPVFADPCQQPLEDFQQIYIKEENVIFTDPSQQQLEDFQQIFIKEENGEVSSSRRGCRNNPNVFCYICGEYCLQKQRRNITDFVKETYLAYFGIPLGDQDRPWAPHNVCKNCVECLRQWKNGLRKCLNFGVPMVWREPTNHHDDCYFCVVDVRGFNRFKKRTWEYPHLKSARRPVAHSEDIPIPVFTKLPELVISEPEEILNLECRSSTSSGSEY